MKTLSDEGLGDALGAQRKQELVRCLGLVVRDLCSPPWSLPRALHVLSFMCPHAHTLLASCSSPPTPAAPSTRSQ